MNQGDPGPAGPQGPRGTRVNSTKIYFKVFSNIHCFHCSVDFVVHDATSFSSIVGFSSYNHNLFLFFQGPRGERGSAGTPGTPGTKVLVS